MADAAGPASTMRAVVRGWTGAMSLDPSYKTPSCGHSEVLLKVKAGAINPVDYKAGRLLGPIVGLDVAGVVEKVGDKVTQLKVGDEVFGSCAGSLADYAVTKPESLGLKPAGLSFAEAAAMPCAYLTSLQSIRDAGSLKEGGRVLVLGASGGCGVAAVQIAKAMGAGHIVGVCSGKNEAFVKQQGADEIADYTKKDILEHFADIEEAHKFDLIYDAASASGGGEDYRAKSLKLLCEKTEAREHGQYVAINGAPGLWVRQFTIGQKRNEHLVMVSPKTADLTQLSEMVGQGQLKPVLAKQLPLTQQSVEEGFELQKSRRAVGKIVFDMAMG